VIPKPLKYYIVQCPRCGNPFMYHPRKPDYRKWQAKCPYCNYLFKVYPERQRSRVIAVCNDAYEAHNTLMQIKNMKVIKE